jgi:hypothetical protein
MLTQRHFSMSTLSATIAIRRYIASHPEADAESAAISIRRLDADLAYNDFAAGLELHRILPSALAFGDPQGDLRSTLSFLISQIRPWWTKGFPYGRERVSGFLERDEAQCFRAAGLFDEPPSAEVVLWWDQRAQTVRAEINERLLLQGREAERLSFAYERDRLKALGVAREPRWIAIEDNTAGFDILSYDQGPVEPVSRLIEVKSSTQNPPRITLTRNEWEAATRFDQSYIFHIWTLPARTLIERRVADMVQHIPKDEGSGVWIAVEIAVRR